MFQGDEVMQTDEKDRNKIILSWPVQWKISPRSLMITSLLVAVLILLGLSSLMFGTLKLSLMEVWQALSGQAEGPAKTVVIDWRLPRALAAAVFGAGLGVSGAIFQSLTQNPLGSPDVIGFSAGSYTGALLVLLGTSSLSLPGVAAGAMVGGAGTALVVYFLAFRHGTKGFRLIVVGIAVSALLGSLNSMLLIRSEADAALSAAAWGIGSLNGISWGQAGPAILLILLCLIISGLQTRGLREMELGDEIAVTHGVPIEKSRLALIITAVALTAFPTAVMGPVSFVALAAPQIARRLAGASQSLVPAAVTGALLLLGADVLAQRLLPGTILPVGMVTLSLGGIYLAVLLFKQAGRNQLKR